MNDFIMIDNHFYDFNENGETLFYKIGTEGFCIYTYLLLIQDRDKKIRTTLKILHNQFKKVSKIKDIRTFKKFMIGLLKNYFIQCDNLSSLTKINEPLIIEVTNPNYDRGFSKINTLILLNELTHIKINGFAVFCLLFKNHNTTFGDGIQGYACCTEEYISKTLNIGLTQVKDSLTLISKRRLVDIKNQDPICVINKYGEEEWNYLPNLYVVKSKIYPDNKYYIMPNKYKEKQKEKSL